MGVMVFYRRNKEFEPMLDGAAASSTTSDNDAELATHLRALGLSEGASWEDITEAHRRLVSDLTPGPSASHRKVSLAKKYLAEVNAAYESLQLLAVA